MLKRKFASELLTRYHDILNRLQAIIVDNPMRDEDTKKIIPQILEALKDIANPLGNNHRHSQEYLRTLFNSKYLSFELLSGDEYLDAKMRAFLDTACEMLDHPDDKHVRRLSAAYGGFFGETLPKIAFSPYLAVYKWSTGDDRGYSGLITTLIFALPLLIPTVVTVLCAALLAVIAGLAAPFAFSGAAITDLCVNAADADNQPSFAC